MYRSDRLASSIWPTYGLTRSQMRQLYSNDVLSLQSRYTPRTRRKKEFSISTCNIHSFRNIKNKIIDSEALSEFLARDLDVDLLCLQEYPVCQDDLETEEMCLGLKEILQEQFPFRDRSCIVGSPVSSLCNITISKSSIENQESKVFEESGPSYEPRCFTVSKVSLSESRFIRVINVHLDVWDGSGKTRVSQIEELISHSSKLNKTDPLPTFLCGDLNATKKEKTYTTQVWKGILDRYKLFYGRDESGSIFPLLSDAGFVSVFEWSGRPNPPFSVWNGTTIDWIMVDVESLKGSKLSDFVCRLEPTLLSDHCALTCSFIME